jgi:AraC-like DNA-binding protein
LGVNLAEEDLKVKSGKKTKLYTRHYLNLMQPPSTLIAPQNPTASSFTEKQIPRAELSPFISEYIFRKIEITSGHPISRIMPMRPVSSVDFFLGDPYQTIDIRSGDPIPFKRCTIRGPRTYSKNSIHITGGNFISFSIRFKPTGLYGLMGVPVHEFRDEATDALTVQREIFGDITERMLGCMNIEDCVAIVESGLIGLQHKTSSKISPSPAVAEMASLIKKSVIPPAIAELEKQVCLSPRQLERNFVREVGVTPKLYSRMVRFANVLQHKRKQSGEKWAALAYEFGYADQMHLIRDFQKFLGLNPTDFSSEIFAF